MQFTIRSDEDLPIRGNIDVAPYPPSRQFWFAVNVGF